MACKPVIFIVETKIDPENEEKFNEWFDKVHIPLILKIPGVLKAQRYKVINTEDDRGKYLAIYDLENEEAIKKWEGPELKTAHQNKLDVWGEDSFTIVWSGFYKHTREKDSSLPLSPKLRSQYSQEEGKQN